MIGVKKKTLENLHLKGLVFLLRVCMVPNKNHKYYVSLIKYYMKCIFYGRRFISFKHSEMFPTIGKLIHSRPVGVTDHPPRDEINQYYSVCTAIWRESSTARCISIFRVFVFVFFFIFLPNNQYR